MKYRGGVLTKVMALLSFLVSPAAYSGELRIGDQAPDFTLPCATKDSIFAEGLKLSDIIGKSNIVLAFYPADWSGGCTKEMCTMRDNFGMLSDFGATVLGISGDYVYSHREWAKYHELPFSLLSDHKHEVATAYQSFNPGNGFNRRTVFVVDRKGKLAYIDLAYKANSAESFEKLKNALQALK